MKRTFCIVILIAALMIPASSSAIGLEVALGMWSQDPSGAFGYQSLISADQIDIGDDAKYDTESRLTGRLKIDMPSLIPNIYIMSTVMEFDGDGHKDINFKFGDFEFSASEDFYSKVSLGHTDITLFYGIPFIEEATMGKFNVEIGLNARLIDFSARVEGKDDFGNPVEESVSQTIPVPMVYVGAQLNPIEYLSIEVEGRFIGYEDNSYSDVIARLKIKPYKIFFIAGGYRQQKIEIDYEDIIANINFSGPFVEVGLKF